MCAKEAHGFSFRSEYHQNANRNKVIGSPGFYLKLTDPDGTVSDVIGNLDGDISTGDAPAWELPDGATEGRVRASLMRRYTKDTNVPLDSTDSNSWRLTSQFQLLVNRYWGSSTDTGNPGYRGEGPLPVTLSRFRAELMDTVIVINWTTESELDNAGFNILRSLTKQGPFMKVNSTLIQGAGTIGERSEYTWTDTTAKPNVVFCLKYYEMCEN